MCSYVAKCSHMNMSRQASALVPFADWLVQQCFDFTILFQWQSLMCQTHRSLSAWVDGPTWNGSFMNSTTLGPTEAARGVWMLRCRASLYIRVNLSVCSRKLNKLPILFRGRFEAFDTLAVLGLDWSAYWNLFRPLY